MVQAASLRLYECYVSALTLVFVQENLAGRFPRFRRLRKTSVPSLGYFFMRCLALRTALSANPLDWGYSGLLVTWVMSYCAAKSLKRWLVNCLPLSNKRVCVVLFYDNYCRGCIMKQVNLIPPQYESTSIKYCCLCHSKMSVATVDQGRSGTGCSWSGSFLLV